MAEVILGISAFFHDSAAVLLVDGQVQAAAQEERFTRIKHDFSFPEKAIEYVLSEAGLTEQDLTAVAFYDKPLLKFERLLETYHAFVPKGLLNFTSSMPVWIKEKIYLKKFLLKRFKQTGKKISLYFPEHHLSHAASAFYLSPFEESAILTVDGVGEWATMSMGEGTKNQIKILRELKFPHSLGLFYSAFTYYLGFAVNDGEYKVMGLAPFGNPESPETKRFIQKILDNLIDLREDGSILINMNYFRYATKLKMVDDGKMSSLLGLPRRKPESEISQSHMNLAWAVQEITGLVVLKLAETARKITNSENLVMAGGVALNCTANSRIRDAGIFKRIWIQPAAGDAGGALGAAFAAYHIALKKERIADNVQDLMQGALLGPQFSDRQVLNQLNRFEPVYTFFEDTDRLLSWVAKKIADGNIVGWFQGRMEFGPRALGNRSILGDPRNPDMQRIMNTAIKFREGFRPFAPSVLAEDADRYFSPGIQSPYMLFVSGIKDELRRGKLESASVTGVLERIREVRSDFPAITHIDYSARLQTVCRTNNPLFWALINEFKKVTGHGMLINTSFNVRDEPIVCNPDDAYRVFLKTGMDLLVIGNYAFEKKSQKRKLI